MSEKLPAPSENIEGISSKIQLRFFRHDEKESVPGKADNEVALTQKGREHAKFLATDTDLSQSLAFGSPRKRTQETAALIMSGKSEGIKGDGNLDTLREQLNENLDYGSKIAVDKRLDFNLELSNSYVAAATDAFKKGQLMKFIVQQSDGLAEKAGDTESSTYSRMAASIASIIKKYIEIAPRWDELVKKSEKKYSPTMERFLGTHQGIQESFLAKVIELTDGIQARDLFIQAINNKGFDYAKGFEVEIVTKDTGYSPSVHIRFKKESSGDVGSFEFDKDIPLETLERICAL